MSTDRVYRSRFYLHTRTLGELDVAPNGDITHLYFALSPHGSGNSEVEVSIAVDDIQSVAELRDALDVYLAEQAIKAVA